MDIAIFGMGYVGCVTASCLINEGHNITGVDVIKSKVEKLNNNEWPVYEPGLNELNTKEKLAKNLYATFDETIALEKTEIGIICVGTPNLPDGNVNMKYLESVINKVNDYFKENHKEYTLLVRSTIPPGSTQRLVHNLLNNNIQIAFLPEFLREGSAINDFFIPSLKVVGCEDDFPVKVLDQIFPNVKGEWIITNYEIAESLKYVSNAWHALKIVYTNEVAMIFNKFSLDTEKVMDIFSKDTILNVSSYYMKPGFAYGGSCLPKELSALIAIAKKTNIKTPLLNAISVSNTQIIEQLELLIVSESYLNIVFVGISFKPDTDDIRNSPIITVIKKLVNGKLSYQKSYNISLYDKIDTLNNFSQDIGLNINKIIKEKEIEASGDIIILGPHKISEDSIFSILNNNKIIIDLKWHKLSEEIKSHINYRSLL